METPAERLRRWQMPVPDADDVEGQTIYRERKAFERYQRAQGRVSVHFANLARLGNPSLSAMDEATAALKEWEDAKRAKAEHLKLILAGKA